MGRLRIVIADDHAMIRAGFKQLLEPQYEVVGCVGDGRALLKTAAELKPDVVLLDVGMPLLNGLDAGKKLKRLMPDIKLIFLTMNPDSDLAAEALRIGASAYLLKNSQAAELFKAIDDAVEGISYVTPQIRLAMQETFTRDPKAVNCANHLTYRQREVLQMLAEGYLMKEIAEVLQIKRRTVRFHKSQIMEELAIGTNSELVQYAIKHSVISPA